MYLLGMPREDIIFQTEGSEYLFSEEWRFVTRAKHVFQFSIKTYCWLARRRKTYFSQFQTHGCNKTQDILTFYIYFDRKEATCLRRNVFEHSHDTATTVFTLFEDGSPNIEFAWCDKGEDLDRTLK
jgi:hypothetical protein